MDDYNREALWIDPQFSYPGKKVVAALGMLMMEQGLPPYSTVGNGPGFECKAVEDFIKNKPNDVYRAGQTHAKCFCRKI